jgi:hypothetical protein
LLVLGDVAAHEEGATVPSGSVQYVAWYGWDFTAQVTDTGTGNVVQPTESRHWLAADGSGRISQHRTNPRGTDGQFNPSLPSSTAGPESSDDFDPGAFDAALSASLPRDPAALRAALLDLMGGVRCQPTPEAATSCLVNEVRALYAQFVIPPDLAAALWTVLAGEPSLKDLGTTIDRLGRPARAIALDAAAGDAETVTVLLISPGDGQLIGTETVTLEEPALEIDRPTVTGFETYTARTWVAAVGDLPGR